MLNEPQSRAASTFALWTAIVTVAGLCWSLGRALSQPTLDAAMAPQSEQAAVSHAPSVGEPDVYSARTTLLVQVAYAESVHDRVALWHVLARRAAAAGVSLEQMATRYVSLLRPAGASLPRGRWVRQVTADCARPAALPASEPWSRAQCERVAADAEAFQRGELADPCEHAPTQWGMRGGVDRVRAARAVQAGRWLPAACSSRMGNAFYREVRR